jgi:hypothetical protein
MTRPGPGSLRIVAASGFGTEFLGYFAVVDDDSSACGRTATERAQTVIADVNTDPAFAPHREIAAASGFRAVQSRNICCIAVDAPAGVPGLARTLPSLAPLGRPGSPSARHRAPVLRITSTERVVLTAKEPIRLQRAREFMSLPACQQRVLDTIEHALQKREPRLASMFAMFTRLNTSEGLPRTERLLALPWWAWRRRRARHAGSPPRSRGRVAAPRVLLLIPVLITLVVSAVVLGVNSPPVPCAQTGGVHGLAISQLHAKRCPEFFSHGP